MNTTNQVSIFLENRPGQLVEILDILASNDVDIFALNISETEDYGIMRIIVQNSEETVKVLKKAGYVSVMTSVFMVGVPNELGGLKGLIDIITREGINVDYMYSMIDVSEDNSAIMIIAADDMEKMQHALDANNIECLKIKKK